MRSALPVAWLAAGLLATVPTAASAAGSITAAESVTVTGGALAVNAIQDAALTVGIPSGGGGNLSQAAWQDATGSGVGWHGQMAIQQFNYTGTWAQTAGSATALASTGSGVYAGSLPGAGYTVTISSFSTPNLAFGWSGAETGSGTATLGVGTTLSNVGTHGVTITWGPLSTTYGSGMAYTIHAGNLGTAALRLNLGSGTITANSGTTSPAPTFENLTATVSGVGPNQSGSAVAFLTAKKHRGVGAYTVVPAATVTVDTSAWAATYSAQLTYSIVSGP